MCVCICVCVIYSLTLSTPKVELSCVFEILLVKGDEPMKLPSSLSTPKVAINQLLINYLTEEAAVGTAVSP